MNKKIVVVDIDGTISHVGERLKYLQQEPKDWDSFYNDCFKDEPIPEMIDLVKVIAKKYSIVFVTGRRESVRELTRKWINNNFGFFNFFLLMRPNDDFRHDTEVKPMLYKSWSVTDDFSNIVLVLEDRTSMVKKWRELGVRCLQVAEGDF